jgi:acetyl esterase/lipase
MNPQEPLVIPLFPNGAPGTEHWSQQEKISMSAPNNASSIRLVRNVTNPTLTVFLPPPEQNTGTSVIVCPGGALHVLAIDHEGYDVARWLNARGIAAFVLKYRLLETPDDDEESEAYMQRILASDDTMRAFSLELQPHVLADAQQAIKTIREHAAEWNLEPDRVGILGFSAGGFVTASLALEHHASTRPDFAAPIYAAVWEDVKAPENAPPLFLALASNDEFGELMISSSLKLYRAWQQAGFSAELHAFSSGGHGFGMRVQGLPSDGWIDRFYDWLVAQGFVTSKQSVFSARV